jgi:hypothetical protein
MVVSIPQIQSALNFFVNIIFICEYCHIFKGFFSYVYVTMILSYIVVMGEEFVSSTLSCSFCLHLKLWQWL